MSWFNMWNGLIKKTCRYMLQRYLGQFLEEKLNLDQLEVDLYSGKATIKNVSLKIEALNEIFESQGWAVEVKGGLIGVLTVNVPWNSLMTSDSSIEISDLHITLCPKKRQSDGTSMLESMWSSVSSSIQLVEECMKQSDVFGETSDTSTFIGIEKFAETIDNVLNRIKAELKNTCITLEYLSPNGSKGIALVVNIDKLSYKNVTGCDKNLVVSPENDADNKTNTNIGSNVSPKTVHLLPTFAKHKIVLNGLSMHSKEFIVSNDFTKIPVMEVKEEMEIAIKVKQSEEVNGPKVILNMELGTLYTFLSPRQVHLLTKICSAFVEEDMPSGCIRKDMLDQQIANSNYHINQNSQTNYMTGILGTNNTWNCDFNGSVSTNCTVENFGNASSALNYNNYCESLTSSVTSNNTENSSSRFKRRNIKIDAFAEILTFNVQISGLFFLILHEDILVETNNYLNEDSQTNMISTATDFFISLKKDENQDPALYSCKKNHIYLYMTPILCKGTQHRNKNILVSNCSITSTKVDLCEVLESKILPIIIFDRTENCSEGYFKLPEVIIDLKSTLSNITEESTTMYEVTLEKSTLELDVTIYDRLSSIFGPSAFSDDDWVKTSKVKCTNHVIENQQGQLTMSISSQTLQLKLRFPINDARPIHDPERIPWWKQNIRDDFLLIIFQSFHLILKNDQVEISAQELSGYYCDKSLDNKKSILKAGCLTVQNELIVPKIVISTPSAAVLMKKINNFAQKGNLKLPYSSERVCRHSDTLHQKRNIIEEESNLLPGERDTINEFCEITQQISKLRICVNLPTADVVIESKNIYEVIYNRLNNDLLMWEPSSPILNRRSKEPDFPNVQSILQSINILSTLPYNPYPYADFEEKTFINNDRNDESISESIYFSTHQENECRSKEVVATVQPSETSFEIIINKGSLVLLVPVRDVEKHIVPEQSGKFHAQINQLKIFCVSGYASNRNLGYMCLQLNEMKVFHCGLTPNNCTNNVDEYMQSTLYNMPKGITKGEVIGNDKRDTFSMVIEIKKQPNQRVKRLNITTGIQKLVLKHNLMPFPSIWLNQLMDFLDVPDYPIQGYSPFGVITEIQLHFWDCAIDYRPKNFPYRAVMEFGSLTIGSNLISTLNGCNLRFILEECVLSIAPFDYFRSGLPDHEITFIGSNNLVPVFDVGLCDISLWLKKSSNESCPNVDLRCSIQDAHLRTCYDSGSALAQLIAFITSDGDLENDVGENVLTSTQFGSDILSSTDSLADANITDKQQERVNLLMAEAVQETVLSTASYSQIKLSSSSINDEIFYFPDECNKTKHLETENEFSEILNFESNVMEKSYVSRNKSNYLPQVKADFGEAITVTNKTEIHIQEEGYCVIADNEKKFMHNCGIQNITLPDDPIRIVDNHFCLPTENLDLLRAPADFPMANLRYTLCEMTFTWHIYGGKDFSKTTTPNEEKKKHMEQSRMSEAYKHGVSYFKASKDVFNSKKPKEKLTWKSRGGPNRDYEVLVEIFLSKARFSHEVYPMNTSQASRQVLLIKEIEIRDRLQASEINKFLCQPVLTNISNKSNQHMVVVKALHVRPHPEQSNTQECSLRISLLPIRLHIDQGTLEFLADFFSNISNYRDDKTTDSSKSVKSSKPNVGQEEHPPIMRVDDVPEAVKNLQARKLVTNNLDLLMENDKYPDVENINLGHKTNESMLPIYFREVIFSPDVPICIDYHGRHVELSRGPIAGLLMGLGQLRCSEIRLQKLTNKRGILGFEKLVYYLCKEWLKDIKRNQLSKILSGVGPTHAFVQMFQGIYDLFWLPIEQYQKDGRIIKGLQLGAQSFSARTAIAALELTSRIIHLLQFTAETAFDMVSPGPSIKRHKKYRDGKKKRPYRPRDIREGVTNAYLIVKEGINDSANALIETAVAEHDQKGYSGAVGAVVRHIPQMVVCPAMLATQATTNILGGVRSSLVPEAKIEAQEKWKDSSN